MIKWQPTEAVSSIVHTSVQDGLCSATYSSEATIRKAIDHERGLKRGGRTALITGLERELRRRAKRKRGGKT